MVTVPVNVGEVDKTRDPVPVVVGLKVIVPEVVIGDPVTPRYAGAEIATEVTVPIPDVPADTHEVVPEPFVIKI
jgi:hypothetical protein